MGVGELELAVLEAVGHLADEAYGANVRRFLAERTGREHSIGAIQTTLGRLEQKGLLRSRASEPVPVRGGRSRRLFVLTAAGRRAAESTRREREAWMRALRPRAARGRA